jgi:non-ribosomal peptide synthetase component F
LQLCLGLAKNIISLDRAYVEQLTVNSLELASIVKSHNALYATFTSGSTGKPKGAVVEHRSCVSGFQAQVDAGFFKENSRVFQFASYSFDSSIEQILATLLGGGTICIPSESERMGDLAGVMNRLAVNLADLTPSVASLLEPVEVPKLRVLRLSGESVPSTLIQKWAGRVRLENSYGPSECCVTSVANCKVLLDTDGTNICRSIGCLTWIVEPNEPIKLAPISTVSELVLQGPIIGRGYINDAQATAAAFMEHASWLDFSGRFPSRLYRTGDLARYDSGENNLLSITGKDLNNVRISFNKRVVMPLSYAATHRVKEFAENKSFVKDRT